jgi:hypothetical protein
MLVMGPTVVVGVVAALITIAAHQGTAGFVYAQQHPSRIDPSQLEAILKTTREPVPTGRGSLVRSARCLHGATGPKLNPWRCTLHYRSGSSITYRVVVALSGHFEGADRTGSRVVHGCCLQGTAR